MGSSLLDRIFRRPSGAFVRDARRLGVRSRVARTLESAASEISPGEPARILSSRELFERAAAHAVVGDGGNLELSFDLVDVLASTVETLGLARSSDVPDPFRRVWVSNDTGHRSQGVVLTHQEGEIAVFCPPSARGIFEMGSVLRLSYRGFSSSVAYDLQLNDAVRLPGTLVLHLTRPDSPGAIGRRFERYPVSLQARVRVLESGEDHEGEFTPCEVVDISLGGLAISCNTSFEQGKKVSIELSIPDGAGEPFSATAETRWTREGSQGNFCHGLSFTDLTQPLRRRVERFVENLASCVPPDLPADI